MIHNIFNNKTDLIRRLTAHIESVLAPKGGGLILPGGQTPYDLYSAIRCQNLKIDWSKVWLTLSDERFVDRDTPRSNEYEFNKRFLKDINVFYAGAKPYYISLRGHESQNTTREEAKQQAYDRHRRLQKLPIFQQPSIAILGMGLDGHIASLFKISQCTSKLSKKSQPYMANSLGHVACSWIQSRNPTSDFTPDDLLHLTERPYIKKNDDDTIPADYQRITWSLDMFLNCDHIILMVEGDAKHKVIQKALSGTPLPVQFILSHPNSYLYWCP
jgi:6-phosphogluconolactonase/glucosamine-6-phosphate isomerase/deaminase